MLGATPCLVISALLGAFFHLFYSHPRAPEVPPDGLENVPGLAWIAGRDRRIAGMNSRMREFFQVPPNSLVVADTLIHPEDRQKTLDLWGPRERFAEFDTHRLLGPDGRYHWFRSAVCAIHDENGSVISSCGTFIDIDDLKAAEEKLLDSQENLRSILDNIPGQIVTSDGYGVNDYCNGITEAFYGRSFHEINGMGYARFVHPEDIDGFLAMASHHIPNAIPVDTRIRQLRHDGVYRWFRMRINPAFDEHGNLVRWYGLHVDIDDEVRALDALQSAQDKLAQASEFSSLGELAASIAHEVNQPLSSVVTNSEVCQLWLSATPPNLEKARVNADRVVRDAKDAANIISRIRELFTKKAGNKEPTDVNEVITDVVHLITKKHQRPNLAVNIELDHSIPLISADRTQLQQLVFNILRNGVEATQSNGEEPTILDVKSRLAGDAVVVEIADNGIGVSDPNKVFEPFFTTKSGGMGIGLSICRSIVDSHKGLLWAKARHPRGAVFTFALPVEENVFLKDGDIEKVSDDLIAASLLL